MIKKIKVHEPKACELIPRSLPDKAPRCRTGPTPPTQSREIRSWQWGHQYPGGKEPESRRRVNTEEGVNAEKKVNTEEVVHTKEVANMENEVNKEEGVNMKVAENRRKRPTWNEWILRKEWIWRSEYEVRSEYEERGQYGESGEYRGRIKCRVRDKCEGRTEYWGKGRSSEWDSKEGCIKRDDLGSQFGFSLSSTSFRFVLHCSPSSLKVFWLPCTLHHSLFVPRCPLRLS